MELRQLRYFVRIVELGSLGRAAKELGVVTSALSQQMSRLEGELSTRLLMRSVTGVHATDAGMAFYRQAQLSLRHADDAVRAAQQARLSGHVSVGMPPSTSAVLALPFMVAMRTRYPDVRLRLVENLSGNLAAMLNARQLDLAVVFEAGTARGLGFLPLLNERLFLIGLKRLPELQALNGSQVMIAGLAEVPLVLPSASHGLRSIVDAAFSRVNCEPRIVFEVDGLAVLMDAVRAGIGATIQPGAATVRLPDDAVIRIPIADSHLCRLNLLASLSEDELSTAALAARVVMRDVATVLVAEDRWPGATLHEK